MERTSKILGIPALICFVVLLLWSDEIEDYSQPLFFILCIIFLVGFIANHIQGGRNRDRAIADRAVAQYKKETEDK